MGILFATTFMLSIFGMGYTTGHDVNAPCAFAPYVTVHKAGANYSYKASACEVKKSESKAGIDRSADL